MDISNALILQWGSCITNRSNISSINGTFNYSCSFTTRPFALVATTMDDSDIMAIRNLTLTTFDVYIFDRYDGYTVFLNFLWIALGI